MRVVLRVLSGPDAGRKLLLLPGQSLRVGRTELADFSLPQDGRMSRVHFELRCGVDACAVQDLHSANGTLVNHQPIVEATLGSGDTITAGATSFVVEIEQADPVALPIVVSGAAAPQLPQAPDEAAESHAGDPEPGPALATAAGTKAGNPYERALADDDPAVRREALVAAAWTAQPWLLDYCRRQAARPSPDAWDALWLLAVLGKPDDVERILLIGRTAALRSRRYQILASYGHPHVVEHLLRDLAKSDQRVVVAAGAAFSLITGAEIGSQCRVVLPPEDGSQPDEFEQAFLDEAHLPDRDLAVRHWQRVQQQFSRGTRWRRGIEVSGCPTAELLAQLDLAGRWEVCLRGRYEGTWLGSRQELERLTRS